MTREEQLTFCKKCMKRKMDAAQGLICSLTGQKASFENECPEFQYDETVKEKDKSTAEQLVFTNQEIAGQLPGDLFDRLKMDQNLPMGLAAGAAIGILGALIWSIVSVATGYQIGYMAIAIGAGVGFGVRKFGKGIDPVFGVVGASISLLGCLLGNFLTYIGIIADMNEMGFFQTLLFFDYGQISILFEETFHPMDLIFYGMALYAGYKFSFRTYTEKDVELLKKRYYKKA